MISLEDHSSVEHSGSLLGHDSHNICSPLIALAQTQSNPHAINLAFP